MPAEQIKSSRSLKELMPERVVKPFMFYADVWNRIKFDRIRMQAYKQMELEGQIKILKVVFSKQDQMVVIEYQSSMPHEWVLSDLKNKVKVDSEQLTYTFT